MRKVIVVLLCLLTSPALAQKRPALTGNPIEDFKAAQSKSPSAPSAPSLTELWNKLLTASTTDLQYASALAGSANTNGSKIRKQCWDEIIAVNQQASGSGLKDAAGNPMTKPDPHLFSDVETLAEVIDNLSPSGPLFTACAGAAELAKMNTLQFINAAITGAAAFAGPAVGLP